MPENEKMFGAAPAAVIHFNKVVHYVKKYCSAYYSVKWVVILKIKLLERMNVS